MGVPFKYKIILPSGSVFVFEQPQWDIDFHFPDGFGLPPIQHQTQDIYQQPGASLKGIKISPRIIPLTLQLKGAKDRSMMHEIRKTLWKTLRWNTTNATTPPDPLILRYESDNVAADLKCYLLSDNFTDDPDSELVQNVSIQLIAYDPFWYRVQGAAAAAALNEGAEEITAVLNVQGILTVNYLAAKVSGIWISMAAGANATVRCFAAAPDGTVYAGGDFTTIGGVAANYVAKWNGSAWSALGSGMGGATPQVYDLVISPDGRLYACGFFTTAGGGAANRVAIWDPISSSWSALGSGLDDGALKMAFDSNGNLYVVGQFLNAGGGGANRIAKWNGSAWSTLGTGFDAQTIGIAISADNTVYVTGSFTTAGGSSAAKIAKWNGSSWGVLGSGLNNSGETIVISSDGSVYVGGLFTTAGGVTVNYVARWNGSVWTALGSGMGSQVYKLSLSSTGLLYAGGTFITAGGIATADRLAVWNGSAWSQLDIDLPGSPTPLGLLISGEDIYIGFTTTGTATTSTATTSIDMNGDFDSFPIFIITGQGTLQWIENIDSGKKMVFNLYINTGETITIDLSPGLKTLTSDSRGNLLPYSSVLPISDFGTWALSPDPIAASGDNNIAMLMTGTTPVEVNDNNTQLSGYASITGVTPDNTAAGGILYFNIVSDGGGFWHIDIYSNSARTAAYLVGHTASYNSNGAKAVVADNSSGLGGTITVDARTAADSDIYAYFATAKVVYKEPFLSADAAVVV